MEKLKISYDLLNKALLTIKADIASEQLLLVELEEQEALITSKRDHLLHIVRTSLARKQGVAKLS